MRIRGGDELMDMTFMMVAYVQLVFRRILRVSPGALKGRAWRKAILIGRQLEERREARNSEI